MLVEELLVLLMGPMVKSWGQDEGDVFVADGHLEPFLRLLVLSQQQLRLSLRIDLLQEQLFEVLQPRPVSLWSKPMRELARALGLAVPESFG